MTTIYLHIGTPKTGTTALQKFLFNNREKLLEKGSLYPVSGMISTQNITGVYSHHGLVKALLKMYDPKSPGIQSRDGGEWKNSWEELKKEIKKIKPKNVILSSELLTYRKEFYYSDMIDLAKRMLEEYETKIVIYVRRQDEFFRSLYCQTMKSPLPQKVPNFNVNYPNINTMRMSQFIGNFKYQANYYSTIELWKKNFGVNNIIVRVFEKEQIQNGNVADDFLDILNLKLEYNKNCKDLNFSNPENISYSGKVIKMINLIELASQIRRLPEGKYWYLYTKFAFFRMDKRIQLAIFLSRFVPNSVVSEELLSKEDRISIMKEFEESNKKLAKEYLGRENGKLFYAKP